MRTVSSVVLGALVSKTRMLGFEKLTFAPGAKFLPMIFKVSWLPGVARCGSTAVTSGAPSSEGWTPAVGAADGAGAPTIVNGASAADPGGLLT